MCCYRTTMLPQILCGKCPRSKQLQVLIHAYSNKYKPDGQVLNLLHHGHRLEPLALAETIHDGDKVVVLQASSRNNPFPNSRDTLVEYPTPARTTSTHSTSAKPKTPLVQLPSAPLSDLKSPSDLALPSSSSQMHTRIYTSADFTWTDFVFARRAWRMRRYGHTGDDPQGSSIMAQQWFNLSYQQKKDLENRAFVLNIDSVPRHRAFWHLTATLLTTPLCLSIKHTWTMSSLLTHMRSGKTYHKVVVQVTPTRSKSFHETAMFLLLLQKLWRLHLLG